MPLLRYESENNIVKHIQAEVGGISAESSGGNSLNNQSRSQKETSRQKVRKPKKRGNGKGIFSNS